MSFPLIEQLYEQTKRVITHPIALTDEQGKAYKEFNDFSSQTHFAVRPPRSEIISVAIEGQDDLCAIPIFFDNKFICYIISDFKEEDHQSINLISSLAKLIAQQFVLEHRPRPDGVDLLLTRMAYKPSSIDEEELEHQMAALGYRLDLKRAAVAINLSGFWDHYLQEMGEPSAEKENLIAAKKRDIYSALSSFFTKNPDNLVGYIGNDTFIVLKDLRDTDYDRFCDLMVRHFKEITDPLKNIHIKEAIIGIGSACDNIVQLLESVAQSLQVLEIGKKIHGPNQAYRFSNLGILPLVLIGGENQKKNYAVNLMKEMNDEELAETLKAFLAADLNLTQAAEILKIHRNTVIYRLDKITQILGKNPRHFPDAVELHLGLMFDRYFD